MAYKPYICILNLWHLIVVYKPYIILQNFILDFNKNMLMLTMNVFYIITFYPLYNKHQFFVSMNIWFINHISWFFFQIFEVWGAPGRGRGASGKKFLHIWDQLMEYYHPVYLISLQRGDPKLKYSLIINKELAKLNFVFTWINSTRFR